MINISSFSHFGKNGLNQDAILIKQYADISLLAIADGMGGAYGGSIAANIALMTVSDLFEEDQKITMKSLFHSVQLKFQEVSQKLPEFKKMATTLTICILDSKKAIVGHVGDTRIYHLRDNGIKYRTKDQTEVQKLLDEGVLTKVTADSYPRKNILLSVMSAYREYELYEIEFEIKKHDRVVLLTDGVYNVLKNLALFRDLSINKDISSFASEVKQLIEEIGVVDDYSAIFSEII